MWEDEREGVPEVGVCGAAVRSEGEETGEEDVRLCWGELVQSSSGSRDLLRVEVRKWLGRESVLPGFFFLAEYCKSRERILKFSSVHVCVCVTGVMSTNEA